MGTTSSLLLSATATSFALPFVYPEVIAEFGWRREEAMLIASTKYGTGISATRLTDFITPTMTPCFPHV